MGLVYVGSQGVDLVFTAAAVETIVSKNLISNCEDLYEYWYGHWGSKIS